MKRKTTWIVLSFLVSAAILLSACQPAPTPPPAIIQTVVVEKQQTVVVQKPNTTVIQTQVPPTQAPAPTQAPPTPVPGANKKVLHLHGESGDIPSIDPSHAQSTIEVQVIEATSLGLVRQNEESAELESAMATDYKISDDGLTYTFTILDNVPWVRYDSTKGQVVKVQDCNGKDRLVTADDYVYGVLRTLNPKTASEYSYVLTPYLEGANDYNSSTETDAKKLEALKAKVAVKALDAKTVQFKFNAPAVYNLNILGLWVAHAQPKWLIEGDDCNQARGDRWTEQGFFQGYGPFTMKAWAHDASLTLVKNPFWPGTKDIPQAKIDEVVYRFLETSAAFAEYEAGNLDIAGIPTGDMDRVKNDPQYKNNIQQVITIGTEWYAFNTSLAPTDDVRVRTALAMSIDKQSLVNNVVKSGIPAPFYTNPGAAGAPKPDKYPDLGLKFDPAKAKEILGEYLKEKNLTVDKVQISLMFNTSEGNKRIAEAIQNMWKTNLGITVQLTNQERKVYYQQRKLGKENVYRCSWVQDYPDANNFLYEVFGPGGGFQDVVKWSKGDDYTAFVDLLKKAALEKDTAKRMDLYAQAEKILLEKDAILAPLYWYSTPVLVRSEIKGKTSITGYDHYEKWDIVR